MNNAIKALVICKIEDRQLRAKVFARLKDKGVSPAQGIFECDLGPAEFERMRKYLQALPYGTRDCITVYTICAVCQKNRIIFGNEPDSLTPDEGWIII